MRRGSPGSACHAAAPPVAEMRRLSPKWTAATHRGGNDRQRECSRPAPRVLPRFSSAVSILHRNGLTRLLHRSFRRAWGELGRVLRLPVGDVGGRDDLVRLGRRIFDGDFSLGHEPERCRVRATLVRAAWCSQPPSNRFSASHSRRAISDRVPRSMRPASDSRHRMWPGVSSRAACSLVGAAEPPTLGGLQPSRLDDLEQSDVQLLSELVVPSDSEPVPERFVRTR